MYLMSNFGFWNLATLYVGFFFWHMLQSLSLGRKWWDEDMGHYLDLAVLVRGTVRGKGSCAEKEGSWEGEQGDFTQCISVLEVDTLGFAGSPDDIRLVTVDLSCSFHFIKNQMQHMPKHCKKLLNTRYG